MKIGIEIEIENVEGNIESALESYTHKSASRHILKADGSLSNGAELATRAYSFQNSTALNRTLAKIETDPLVRVFLSSGNPTQACGLHVHISTPGLDDALLCVDKNPHILRVLRLLFRAGRRENGYVRWEHSATAHYAVLNRAGRDHFEFRGFASSSDAYVIGRRIVWAIGLVGLLTIADRVNLLNVSALDADALADYIDTGGYNVSLLVDSRRKNLPAIGQYVQRVSALADSEIYEYSMIRLGTALSNGTVL